MLTYLRRLVDERTTLTETIERTSELAAAEERDMTATEQSTVSELQTRCAEIDRQLETYNEQAESTRAFAALQSRLEERREEPEQVRNTGGIQVATTGWGEMFTSSDEFRSYNGHGRSGNVGLERYLETRAPITTASLPIPAFQLPPVIYETTAPLLDVVARVPVSSGTVEWVEMGGDPQAAVVPEGSLKPEAAFVATPKAASLDTLAHWVQVTRQALEDAAYLQALIEGKLRRGLLNKAEADMATAIDAATTQTADAADLLASIRVGIGEVEAAGYRPNAVLLNPADYAELDLAVMGVTVNGATRGQTFWGLQAVAAGAIPAGKAYVGDFKAGATLFDRNVSNVFLSDSHADVFLRNILVILAEARVKSAVTEPNAICECTVTT